MVETKPDGKQKSTFTVKCGVSCHDISIMGAAWRLLIGGDLMKVGQVMACMNCATKVFLFRWGVFCCRNLDKTVHRILHFKHDVSLRGCDHFAPHRSEIFVVEVSSMDP